MRLATVFLVAFSISFNSNAFACPTPEVPESFRDAIEKMFAVSDVWRGYDPGTLKLAIGYGSASNVLLFNFSNEDLRPKLEQVVSCDRGQFKWSILKLRNVPTPANGIYEPKMPNPSGDDLQLLANYIGAPVLFINSEAKIGDVVFKPMDIARIAIHEMFHFAHQFAGKFKIENGFERTFLDRCIHSEAWLNQVRDEFSEWKSILQDWSTVPNEILRTRTAATLKRRMVNQNDAEVAYCWEATGFWERMEGSAFYIETAAAKKAKFITDIEIRNELLKYLNQNSQSVCTGCPDNNHGEISRSYFYGTGAIIISILQRITGTSSFQQDIEAGATPADVFQHYALKSR